MTCLGRQSGGKATHTQSWSRIFDQFAAVLNYGIGCMSGGNNRCFVHHRVRSPEGFCSQALVNLLAAAVEFLLPEIVPDNPVGLGDAPGGAMFAPLTTFY
ncbi:MAG: hypothetical protein DCO81_06795, partial [Candidatus Aquiluna sp. XM-24bin5]